MRIPSMPSLRNVYVPIIKEMNIFILQCGAVEQC